MDVISRTLDSVVSVVGQASQRTLYYRRHLILESLLSDPNKAKTMLNDWKCALVDNTSKDVFGNKFEEEICRSSKIKTKSKDVFKGIASSNQPFHGGPLLSRSDMGRSNRGFTVNFKGLNFTKGKRFVSTTSRKIASSSRLSQVHLLVRSLFPENIQCWYFRKKWEKLSSDQAVLNIISSYKVPFSEVPRQS